MDFIRDKEFIMHDTLNDNYYAIKFTDWGQNNGGSFAYRRRLIDTNKLNYGLQLADGFKVTSETLPDIKDFKFNYLNDSGTITYPGSDVFMGSSDGHSVGMVSNNGVYLTWAEKSYAERAS